MQEILIIGGVVVGVLGLLPVIVSMFLRDVEAGTIRLVSWLQGTTVIYRGPGKSKEIPLLTTGTTISSKVLNVDLDITDQTADLDEQGFPQPIKVRVLASAIVSVGDSDAMLEKRVFARLEEGLACKKKRGDPEVITPIHPPWELNKGFRSVWG